VLAEPARHRRFAFLRKAGWIGAIVGALAFTAACWLILAPWQFSRNAETSATNRAIDSALTSTPVPVRQYLSTDRQPAANAIWQRVTATGVLDPAHTYYVRLRQDSSGEPVSEVVLPMRLDDGTVLLVDRGYRSIADIGTDPLPSPPSGRVTVTGRVQQDQTDPRNRQPAMLDGLPQAYAVNSKALAGPSSPAGSVLQGYIQLVADSPGVLTEIGMPQTDDGPYLSYALQWCAFGAMSLLAIAYFIYREATDPRGPDDRNVPFPQRTESLPVAGDKVAAGAGQARAKRPPKDGFDRSQLYD
jgi:cytochrome oxidase assembly protein ShyY1